MAAVSLYGLTEDQTVWALGNAGMQSSGLWEFMASGSMSKRLHAACAALSGLLSAYLARDGFIGPDAFSKAKTHFALTLNPNGF